MLLKTVKVVEVVALQTMVGGWCVFILTNEAELWMRRR